MTVAQWIEVSGYTLAATVTAGTTILYAALGELLTERAGVLNLGVEGMMLCGAVAGFGAALALGNPWLGVAAAALAGAALALVHAVLSVSLRANQIVSGLSLTIFGTGLASYVGKPLIGVALSRPFQPVPIPVLEQVPVLGPALFNQNPLVYLSYVLIPLLAFWLYRTPGGLNLRAVGENPGAADAAGIPVARVRHACTVLGGLLAGVAGAHLSLAVAPSWVDGMVAGRGWVAVALVIFAAWDPWRAVLGAYLFGGVEALSFRIQAFGTHVSHFFLNMLPYLFTIAVLVGAVARTGARGWAAPAALGLPYDREQR